MTEHSKQQLFELTKRIEFLQASTDHDILVCTIEREICEVTAFECSYDRFTGWWYDFDTFKENSVGVYAYTTYNQNKLQALHDELLRITKD